MPWIENNDQISSFYEDSMQIEKKFDIKIIAKWKSERLIANVDKVDKNLWEPDETTTHKGANALFVYHDTRCFESPETGSRHHIACKILEFDYFWNNELKKIYEGYYGEGKIIKVLASKLKPNSYIPKHIDEGMSFNCTHRTHIPLITNPDVIMQVGNTSQNMEIGNIYEINNLKEHMPINNSNQPRTHLIIDYLPFSV